MPLNNDDIINRLIENQKETDLDQDLDNDGEQDIDQINKSRVTSLKYKLYLFLSLVWLYIVVSNFVLPAWDKLWEKKSSFQTLQTKVAEFDTRKKALEKDRDFINNISSNKNIIVSCLNQNQDCAKINSGLRSEFSIVRSYLQIWNLSSKKMVVNEKYILANINEYLIRNMQDGDVTNKKNWSIDRISIWEPVKFEWKLSYVPVRLNISFENKDYLLDFISNVERKILVDKDYRILYKIDQVSYDIVEYQDKQNVDVVLVAYYYQD